MSLIVVLAFWFTGEGCTVFDFWGLLVVILMVLYTANSLIFSTQIACNIYGQFSNIIITVFNFNRLMCDMVYDGYSVLYGVFTAM